MDGPRLFHSGECFQPAEGEPLRTVVTQTTEAAIVAWHVGPGQRIAPHIHTLGQDTWVILSGTGDYIHDALGNTYSIKPGDILVAAIGQVHGVVNLTKEPLTFISVVSPGEAGYQPI